MCYIMSSKLREAIESSIVRNKKCKYRETFPIREITPRNVLLANGRIVTTADARREIAKYRKYGAPIAETMNKESLIQRITNSLCNIFN